MSVRAGRLGTAKALSERSGLGKPRLNPSAPPRWPVVMDEAVAKKVAREIGCPHHARREGGWMIASDDRARVAKLVRAAYAADS